MGEGKERLGLFYGFLGMLGFSQTLPATRIAVFHLDPVLIGLGRVCLAAIPAALLLLWDRQKIPKGREWGSLSVVMLGVVLGFPLFSALSMQDLPASHGAILTALLPLATVVVTRLRSHENPSSGFWITAVAGTLLVGIFAFRQGGGQLQSGDLALLIAVTLGGLGYAEGGRLARVMSGWRVICWALVMGAPIALLVVLAIAAFPDTQVPLSAWLSFGYVSLISQLFGFFFWYQGLAIGGVARVSQLQLLMPFFSLVGAWFLLSEALSFEFFLFALSVVAIVFVNRQMKVEIQGRR